MSLQTVDNKIGLTFSESSIDEESKAQIDPDSPVVVDANMSDSHI